MTDWLFDPTYSAIIGGWSFILSVLGTPLTIWGLWLTYRQARDARKAAAEAQLAVSDFKFRNARYDAFRDLSQASYALDMTRRHVNNTSWRDAAESYEDARRALIRVQTTVEDLPNETKRMLELICSHLSAFCKKVDAALAGKGDFPDAVKVLQAIRKHHEKIAVLQNHLQKDVD